MLYNVISELFLNNMLQKLLKYLNRWQSYGKNKSDFFWDTVYRQIVAILGRPGGHLQLHLLSQVVHKKQTQNKRY